jgi:hypothetical protein
MTRRTQLAIAVLGASLVAVAAAGAEDQKPALSAAQIALFESDHLHAIARPERLEYRFSRETVAKTGDWVDRVDLDVRPRGDGLKDVWVDFLAGEHHVPFPPLIGFRGNPVLMHFLQRDVDEMRRATGGAATYFRNRIRRAFIDQAALRQIELQRDGKAEAATEITVSPFRDDARLAGFPGLNDKTYRFILSDAVPGTLYQIASETPGDAAGGPLLKETIIFVGEHPCEGGEGPCAPPRQP